MARFAIPAARFPWSPVQIRTRAGLVDFIDHAFETDDEDLAAALREVPHVFGIVEEGEPPEWDDESDEDETEPDDEETKRPSVRASKAEWVAYAEQAHGIPAEEAEEMTKAELIETFGG